MVDDPHLDRARDRWSLGVSGQFRCRAVYLPVVLRRNCSAAKALRKDAQVAWASSACAFPKMGSPPSLKIHIDVTLALRERDERHVKMKSGAKALFRLMEAAIGQALN